MTKTAPTGRQCWGCGHAASVHDTGWDSSGCMRGGCSCSVFRAKPEPTPSPTGPGGGAAPEAETLHALLVGCGILTDSGQRSALTRAITSWLEATRAAALEEAAEVGSQEAWDTAYAEDKAVSKGGAPYTTAFRAANAASRVGTAIRALANPEDKG